MTAITISFSLHYLFQYEPFCAMEVVHTVLVLLIIVPQAYTILCHVISCDQQYSCAPQTVYDYYNEQPDELTLERGDMSKCSEKWPTVCDSSSDVCVFVCSYWWCSCI